MITFGEKEYIPALKEMWKLCFASDDDDFIDFYFSEVYAEEQALVYVMDKQPVAFLQMIPFEVGINGQDRFVEYISGVMTHPSFRKQGYMKELLLKSLGILKTKPNCFFAFLIPQEAYLYDIYAKYGFQQTALSMEAITIIFGERGIILPTEPHYYDENGNYKVMINTLTS
jgi:predicted acetyltransferase